MRRNFLAFAILAAGAALVAAPGLHAETLQSAELARLIGSNGFEFRGRNTMWRFSADGRVSADDSRIPSLSLGGSSEQFSVKNAGTWRRADNRICIKWDTARSGAEECYTVTPGQGRMVTLAGTRTIQGTIDPVDVPGYAATPEPSAPNSAAQPRTNAPRFQRIPGAR